MTQHDAHQPHDHRPAPATGASRNGPTPTTAPRPHVSESASKPKSATRQEQRSIALSQGTLDYTLRTSARARRVRLLIQPGGALEVVAPHGASQARVDAALREHEVWITRTRDRLAKVAPIEPPQPLATGRLLPIAGRTLQLSTRTGAPEGRFRVHLTDDTLLLTLPREDEELTRAALEAFYRRQARSIIAERLALWNAHYGYTWTRLSIKEQKTRWGSCSRAGSLNFNWRLLLAPLPALDYVVIHELCHLKEPNHAAGFWALVAQTCPDYREWRGWLRKHGHELRL